MFYSAEELIGNTPLLELKKIEEKYNLKAKLFAKLEFFNPAGSAKDRVGKAMLDDAEKKGLIGPGSVIIEPTSGNTGIGLASVAAIRGYKVIIVMPDNMSKERILLMKAYGADLVLTPAAKGMSGAIEKAEELAKEIKGSYIPGQFVNPANAYAHYISTGPEIWKDTNGQIDVFACGIGTGGTITGTGKYLKEQNPNIEIVGVEPASSPFLTEGKSGSHKIQGIGAGFKPEVLDLSIVDRIIPISDQDALDYARVTGPTEGFLCGISSGAALCAGIELAKQDSYSGKNIVVLLPDNGDHYLSTELYDF